MVDLDELAEAIIDGEEDDAVEITEEALNSGIDPSEILNNGLIKGMTQVGEYFKNNEFYVPEVLIAAKAMQQAMNILKPKLLEAGAEPCGLIAIGTVKGDVHDIGKNLVSMMLEGNGFQVMDLGVDVKAETFIEAINKGAKIISMSALLTTTMPYMKTVIDEIEKAGLRNKVKIMVGGAPVTESYAKEIGADGYATDAAEAVDVAKKLIL